MKPNYYSSIVNKKIYECIYPIAATTCLHPNTITCINIFLDIVCIASLYFYNTGKLPKHIFIPLFLLFICIHTFLDFLDGAVARVQKKTSKIGATLDNIADALFYIPYFFYMLYVALYLRKGVVIFVFGVVTLLYTIGMLSARFKSMSAAIEYIGLYFEIDQHKIPLEYHDKDAPITDYFLLFMLMYVFPMLIISQR